MSRFSRIVNVEDLKVNSLDNVPGKSIGSNFVAKTFIYTGDETGAPGAAGTPGQPGKPGVNAPAGRSAQTLKERAEGKGAE